MNTAGQAELVVLLELTSDELGKENGLIPPNDIFLHFQSLYTDALKGKTEKESQDWLTEK